MKRVRLVGGLAGLGLAVGFAGGQAPPDPKPKAEPTAEVKLQYEPKKSLEDAIAAAMKNNPDVRVAEAEVQVAQAKLAQAKLAVAQKVAAAHAAIERDKAAVAVAEAEYGRVAQLHKKGFVSADETGRIRQALEAAKAAVAKSEAEYNALLGVMPGQAVVAFQTRLHGLTLNRDAVALGVEFAPAARQELQLLFDASVAKPTPGSVADKLREALDKPVTIKSEDGKSLPEFLDWLNKEAEIDIRFRWIRTGNVVPGVSIKPGIISVGAILQLIEDESAPEDHPLRFVVREYGVLVTDAKTLPQGAVTVQEFWKRLRAEKAKAAKDKAEPKK